MLPHYFQMHASVTAAGYAAAMCRHAARMSFDQSQFVAVIGDSRGLFVVAPGRDAAEHCHGVQPLYIDGGSSIAALGRGAYDVSLSGHVYPSTADNVAGFEASLPQRLQLPTPLHRIRSITTVTVPAPHDAQPADTTTIMEKLFTTDDVVPQTLAHPAAVWESTVEVVRTIPTHPAWREAVNLLASAPSSSNAGKRGGRSKSVTKLSAKR